jgi:hypothetical protein
MVTVPAEVTGRRHGMDLAMVAGEGRRDTWT